MKTDPIDAQKMIQKVTQLGHGHVFQFWDELNNIQKEALISQLAELDFHLIEALYQKWLAEKDKGRKALKLETAPIIKLSDRQLKDQDSLRIGVELLKQSKVAAFLVAGGQGSRLGFEGPKGMYPISPVQNKTLFQLHAEKILAIRKKYNSNIPWYIMTSETNHEQTVHFFIRNEYFGLPKEDIFFFAQEMLPAIDMNGKLILEKKYSIFRNPNGHGGSIKGLWDSGAIDDMKRRGIEHIFYFQVDNVLVKMCDPVFLGYHKALKAEMSNKALRKFYPEEKMGVICKLEGNISVVEYSDLPEKEMYEKDENGALKYWGGNLAIHIIDTAFVEKENKSGFALPYHFAEKSIPYLNEKGDKVASKTKNGIKFETFVFDALKDVKNSVSLEVERADEFSALKNKTGLDSAESSKYDMRKQYTRWLEAAGFELEKDENGCAIFNIEISPLFAENERDVYEKKNKIGCIKNNAYWE
jgi:UDP-N-acetylglucosamine/UDP-N-acetylgalactosamine diphosphorylase